MTEISLAWLLTKVTAPVVGATKLSHVEGMAKAVDICLTKDEITYLEEPYVPHRTGRSHGAEYSGPGEGKTCLVYREPEAVMVIIRTGRKNAALDCNKN